MIIYDLANPLRRAHFGFLIPLNPMGLATLGFIFSSSEILYYKFCLFLLETNRELLFFELNKNSRLNINTTISRPEINMTCLNSKLNLLVETQKKPKITIHFHRFSTNTLLASTKLSINVKHNKKPIIHIYTDEC